MNNDEQKMPLLWLCNRVFTISTLKMYMNEIPLEKNSSKAQSIFHWFSKRLTYTQHSTVVTSSSNHNQNKRICHVQTNYFIFFNTCKIIRGESERPHFNRINRHRISSTTSTLTSFIFSFSNCFRLYFFVRMKTTTILYEGQNSYHIDNDSNSLFAAIAYFSVAI